MDEASPKLPYMRCPFDTRGAIGCSSPQAAGHHRKSSTVGSFKLLVGFTGRRKRTKWAESAQVSNYCGWSGLFKCYRHFPTSSISWMNPSLSSSSFFSPSPKTTILPSSLFLMDMAEASWAAINWPNDSLDWTVPPSNVVGVRWGSGSRPSSSSADWVPMSAELLVSNETWNCHYQYKHRLRSRESGGVPTHWASLPSWLRVIIILSAK